MPRRPSLLTAALGVGLAVLYLAIAVVRARFRLLSAPEIEEFWAAQNSVTTLVRLDAIRSLGKVEAALIRVSTTLFHATPLAIRLPSILLVGAALLLGWRSLQRRVHPITATALCLALMLTPALLFADRATTGALVLFVIAAILCLLLRALPSFDEHQRASAQHLKKEAALMSLLAALIVTQAGFSLKSIKLDRRAFFRFVDAVERANAPGELVIVSDRQTAAPLFWYASPASQKQIVLANESDPIASEPSLVIPSAKLTDFYQTSEEQLLVGDPGGITAQGFASHGYSLLLQPETFDQARLSHAPASLLEPNTQVILAIPHPHQTLK